jgi:hypothetical protein
VFQPYPCAAMGGSLLAAVKSDIAAARQDYPNVVLPDPALFEPWPAQVFSSADHVKTGYEDAVSRRAGRLIASALGLSPVEPNPPLPAKAPILVWSNSDFGAPPWRAEGLSVVRQSDGVVATETTAAGLHHVEAALPDLPPGRYVASLTFADDPQRLVFLQFLPMLYPGDSGNFTCDAADRQVARTMSILDADLEELPNRKLRCRGKFILTRPGVRLIIGLSQPKGTYYSGDERSQLRLYGLQLSRVDEAD